MQALEQAAAGGLRPQPQPGEGVTYAHKIEKAEAALDWRAPAAVLARRVRAFNPFPGASTALAGEPVKVWAAHAAENEDPAGPGRPGEVLALGDAGIRVRTGDGVLVLTELQRAGGRRLAAGEFLRGLAWQAGQVFDAAPAREVAG